ncbi:MAG: DUF4476 domain-containing protein [Pedobacter sp.]|nr:DUF4476 domain-containing protein [Pedobacter sp.]MDQ7950172.1 DUF4476 domain-containing protein [Cellulomonas sp.]MDQ8052851.1 DUF4476 domain-containing protein [Pedobacter sp.]
MKNYVLLGMALLLANLGFAQRGRNNAEVFIQIADRGSYTVYLDNEFIGSASGKFRFYEVYHPTAILSISENNRKIFSKQISVRPNERLILNYSQRQGLTVINSLPMYRNGQYVLNDFDGYLGSYNTGIVPPREVNSEYNNLSEMVRKAPFDDDKVNVLQSNSYNIRMTTDQAAALLKSFMRDEYKLTAVKILSRSITDFQNMYHLQDAFTFNAGKEELLAYLKGSPDSIHVLNKHDFEALLANVKKEAFDDQKTKIIQAALSSASPSTAQVGELIKTYTFDDNALNLVKLLYRTVSDPQRYYSLKDSFRYLSNREAFTDFLGQQ